MKIIIDTDDENIEDALKTLSLIGMLAEENTLTSLDTYPWFNSLDLQVYEGPLTYTILRIASRI